MILYPPVISAAHRPADAEPAKGKPSGAEVGMQSDFDVKRLGVGGGSHLAPAGKTPPDRDLELFGSFFYQVIEKQPGIYT